MGRFTPLMLVWFWLPVAAAQPPPKTALSSAQTKKLYRQATKALSDRKYEEALAKLLKVEAHVQSYKVVYKIAVTLDAMGRHPESVARYEQFLVLARAAPRKASVPQKMLQVVQSRIDQLKHSLASVRLLCNVSGATVMLDGQEVGRTPVAGSLYAKPGTHTVSVSKEGYVGYTKELVFTQGEHKQEVALLEKTPQAPTANPADQTESPKEPAINPPITPVSSASMVTDPGPSPGDDDVPQDPHRGRRTWGKVAVGGGAALLVGATLLYFIGSSKGNAAHDSYMQARDHEEIARHWSDVQSAETTLVVGHVLLGASVAALGTAAYLFLSTPSPSPRKTQVDLSVGLAPLGEGAALSISGRY